MLKVVRRRNVDPILNGALLSDEAQNIIKDMKPDQNYKKNRQSQYQQINRQKIQMDVLQEFKNYDELYFKKNLQDKILEVGIS